jgi:hypothetical protein
MGCRKAVVNREIIRIRWCDSLEILNIVQFEAVYPVHELFTKYGPVLLAVAHIPVTYSALPVDTSLPTI